MLVIDSSDIYLVTGTTETGTMMGFLVLPVNPDIIDNKTEQSPYGGNSSHYYDIESILGGGAVTDSFIAALKSLFDGVTYGTSPDTVTVSSPEVTHFFNYYESL